jgi:hypothetical protein
MFSLSHFNKYFMMFSVSNNRYSVSNLTSQDILSSHQTCPSIAKQLALHVCHEVGDSRGGNLQALAAYRYNANLHALDSNHHVLTYLHPDGQTFKVVGIPAKEHAFTQAYNIKNWETGRLSFEVRPIQNEACQVVWMSSACVGLKGGAPVARVDLKDKFEIKRSHKETTIVYTGVEFEHLLEATVKNKTLNFYVCALEDASQFGSGKDMFISLMNRLQEESIEVDKIRAEWGIGCNSVNTEVFLNNQKLGMSPPTAARNTWTGRLVAEYGFHPRSIAKHGSCYHVMFKKG